jgi:hypothetical protein
MKQQAIFFPLNLELYLKKILYKYLKLELLVQNLQEEPFIWQGDETNFKSTFHYNKHLRGTQVVVRWKQAAWCKI